MKMVRLALDTLWQRPARSPADGCCPTPQLGVSLAEEAPPFQARPCLFAHGSLDLRENPRQADCQQLGAGSLAEQVHIKPSRNHSMNRTLAETQILCQLALAEQHASRFLAQVHSLHCMPPP